MRTAPAVGATAVLSPAGVPSTAPVNVPDVTVIRPTLDDVFNRSALLWAERSTCSRRQVGAVVALDGHTVATGYNGVPSGATHCVDGGCPRGRMSSDDCPPGSDYNTFPCHAVHAEANAIFRAGMAGCKDATLYVTCEPCQQCWNLIAHARIRRVVYPGSEEKG